jgi:hypothetical protein
LLGKSGKIRNKKNSSKEVHMGYWFSGFFLRTTDQDPLPELVSSIKEQWPRVVCRLVKEPFVGLGVRMTNFTWGVDDEKGEDQLAIEDELPTWSKQHPFLTVVYLEADCFGGTCIYRGYVCQNGEIHFKEKGLERGPEPLGRLLKQIHVELRGGAFPPFGRNFFGSEHYFRQGHVEEDLEDFLRQNRDFNCSDAN